VTAVVTLAVGVAIVLALPLAWRIAGRRFDPFEPIVVFALAWGVMFVVRPIAIVVRDDTNFYGVEIRSTLDQAVLLGLLGAVAFVVGHEVPMGPRLAHRLPRTSEVDPSLRLVVVALAVGGLATISFVGFLLWAGGVEALDTFLAGRSEEFDELLQGSPLYLWTFSFAIVPAALLAVAVAMMQRRTAVVLGAAALVGVALLRILPTGTRLYLLILVGGAVVLLYLRRGRRPGVVGVAIGLTAALVASYALVLFRDAYTRESAPSALEAVASTPSRVFSPLVEGPDAEMAPALAGALLAVPSELPHRYGAATLGDLVVRPIPRQLWSGKPQPHVITVTEEVWPVARATGNFAPNFTPVLSFYWDFGLPGVFLGLVLYGVLARLAYAYLLRQADNWVVQLLYALALWLLVLAVRADPVLLALNCFIMFVSVLAIVRVSGSHSRETARGEAE
jgi:ABC-type amino acid transport system permease subunit